MIAVLFAIALLVTSCAAIAPGGSLAYQVHTGGPKSYGVTSTVVYGPTEALLVDAQFNYEEAGRLADEIDHLGRRLTTIFITHPDPDHYVGLAVLQKRFPGARILMTDTARSHYRMHIQEIRMQYSKGSRRAETPPAEPIAQALSGKTLVVDGQRVEVIADLQGDVADMPANSAIWVPSLRLLVAGDLAFEQVHPYLDESTPKGRAAWAADVRRLEDLRPAVVVAGHKRDAGDPDSPGVLEDTSTYVMEFDRELNAHADAAGVEAEMLRLHPDYGYPLFLKIASRSAHRTAP
ncbi:MAG TPA: MBL fold metallo-hydrolase [Usitatibacter sp.]|nr:MBL fold metallo-hydrolase [Usitatibacter sp.]